MIRDAGKPKPVIALLLLLGTLLLGACSALRQDRHAHGPYWSPDGRRVLFTIVDIYKDNLQVTGKHICVLDLVGDTQRVWLDNAATNGGGEVKWSPDGQRLAFSSGPGVARDVDIFVLDIQTRKVSRLTQLEGISLSPHWSPDGSRLAFIWHEAGWDLEDYFWPAQGVTALYVVNADGSNLRELVRVSPDENLDFGFQQPWSPDGKKLVFDIDKDKGNKLYVADVDTGRIDPLTDHSGWYESDYEWSPDSQRIAFTSKPDRERNDAIYMVDADGRNLRYVTEIGDNSNIYWAPDGVHLAFFFRKSDGEYVAYVATASGSEIVRLAGLDPAGRLFDLAWSPDGRKILAEYIGENPLYITDVASRTSIPVPPPADSSWSLEKWSPDGRWIAASTMGSNKGVFLINPENGEAVPLIVLPNSVISVVWMPDGERVAFLEYPEDEQAVIYIVGLDGQVLRKIEADCKWPLD